ADPARRPGHGRTADATERHARRRAAPAPSRLPFGRLADPVGQRAAGRAPRAATARRARRRRADLAPVHAGRREGVARAGRAVVPYRPLLVERGPAGHVVTVTLNRPEQMNAMNTAMGEDVLACFDALARDRDVRAVVLTGAGERAFCAGGDLKERNEMTDEAWRAQHV